MNIERLLEIMDTLLGENGCPWDKEQTHESLRKNMLEECHEVIEAIDQRDMDALCDELGDVLLNVIFHAKLAEKAGVFNLHDVISGICDKLTRRHSHIFGEDKATSPEDALRIWHMNKQNERLNPKIP